MGRSTPWACAGLVLALCGCGGDDSSPGPPVQADLPEFDECVSTVPIDYGYPDQPVITLKGARVVNLPAGTFYADAGATATDPKEGDLTSRIVVTGAGQVAYNTPGDYMIRYNVFNSTGLRAVEAVRIVRVTGGTFTSQTARESGSTSAHMGYYEHLPVHYGDDPSRKFPLLIFIHGWGSARFLDARTVQAPLTVIGGGNIAGLISGAYPPYQWDNSLPFVVLSPQKCVDALTYGVTASRMKLFIDYAINTYNVDTTRIYVGGHSQGSGDAWDYVNNYPRQLAAIFPIAGGYGTVSGCTLKNTPAWAFAGELDTPVNNDQINTVASINACSPPERAKVTILPGATHNGSDLEVITLSGLGQGLAPYDLYDQSIYDWLLAHQRSPSSGAAGGQSLVVEPNEISAGGRATLRWAIGGASACEALGDWLGTRPPEGFETVAPATPGEYNYVLSCGLTSGTVAATATLTVESPGARPGYRVAAAALDSYVGRYRLEAGSALAKWVGEEIEVRRERGELVLEAHGLRLSLAPRSDNEFEAAGSGTVVTFHGNGNARCPSVTLTLAGRGPLRAQRIR